MSPEIRFWLFLIAMVPSVMYSAILLLHTLYHASRRRKIHNHFIIILFINNLIYELISIPLFLNYYRIGSVLPNSPSLCLMWMFIDETLFTVSTVTVAWASIERHILIFHQQWLSTNRRRILLHYFPYTFIISYVVVFHFVAIVLPPCENVYDYTQALCGRPLCFHNTRLVGTWDSTVNNIIPTLAIIIFSTALLIRILLQNRRMRRNVQWRKNRKMAIQLFTVSILYFVLYLPAMTVELAELCCVSHEVSSSFNDYAQFFSYYVIFLLPFVYMFSLVKNSRLFRALFPCWCASTQAVHPEMSATTHYTGRRAHLAESAM